MQSTIYVEMPSGVTVDDLYEQLKIAYQVTFFWPINAWHLMA